MILYERQKEILNYLKTKQFSTVRELSKLVWSSESSVRRDIKTLEQKGYVRQIYGGVVLEEYTNSVIPVDLRDSFNSSIKEELAKEASKYVFDGATILMDGSSTVRRIAKYISHYKGLKIITNNQLLFRQYSNSDVQLYCTGGLFLNQSNIFVGSTAENYVNSINADILFFSSQAISEDGEISDVSEEETALRRAKQSRQYPNSPKAFKKRLFLRCRAQNTPVLLRPAASKNLVF